MGGLCAINWALIDKKRLALAKIKSVLMIMRFKPSIFSSKNFISRMIFKLRLQQLNWSARSVFWFCPNFAALAQKSLTFQVIGNGKAMSPDSHSGNSSDTHNSSQVMYKYLLAW